jgi:hypothetical protein
MAVVFTLYLKEDVDEAGNIKEGVEGGKVGYGGALEGKEETEEVKATSDANDELD